MDEQINELNPGFNKLSSINNICDIVVIITQKRLKRGYGEALSMWPIFGAFESRNVTLIFYIIIIFLLEIVYY